MNSRTPHYPVLLVDVGGFFNLGRSQKRVNRFDVEANSGSTVSSDDRIPRIARSLPGSHDV